MPYCFGNTFTAACRGWESRRRYAPRCAGRGSIKPLIHAAWNSLFTKVDGNPQGDRPSLCKTWERWAAIPGIADVFSNHPDLHNRVLENRTTHQTSPEEQLQQLFHFSSENYGDYCLCFYLLPIFLIPVAPHVLHRTAPPDRNSDSESSRDRLLPGIQRIPTISTQTFVSKANTIKRNPSRTFPPGRKLL